jgi:hypothetical protein
MVKQKAALPPNVLSPYMANVYRALVLLGIVGIVLGSCGLAVLIDVEQKRFWFSHTKFAELWVFFTEKNPMLTNICLNGGLMAIIVSFLRLQAHSKGLQLSASGKKTS